MILYVFVLLIFGCLDMGIMEVLNCEEIWLLLASWVLVVSFLKLYQISVCIFHVIFPMSPMLSSRILCKNLEVLVNLALIWHGTL